MADDPNNDVAEDLENEELGEEEALTQEFSASTRVPLGSGEPLVPMEVSDLLRWRPAVLVAIVGNSDSGKSTLICALYDRYLRGAFGGFTFCSSLTLVGLEKRSHYSRVESGLAVPETARTPISEGLTYFHLAVAPDRALTARSDLLISDRAGEVYRQARSNSELVPTLAEIVDADHVTLLLDGAKLVDLTERAGAMQSVRQTLRALIDGNALSASTHVQIVLTKLDLVSRSPEKQEIEDLLNSFRAALKRDFASRVAELEFWEIAARDPTGEFAPASGIEKLLVKWLTPKPVKYLDAGVCDGLVTEFDRLRQRLPAERTW